MFCMTTSRLTPLDHFTPEELRQKHLACKEPVEREHWLVIWLLAREDKDYTCPQVADILGYTSDWVRKLVRRYNSDPHEGLRDKRKDNGNQPILDDALMEELQFALLKEPPDKGLWSGPKVAHWISEKTGRDVHAATGWRWLIRAGWSLQVPRRQHKQSASEEEQEAFKKTPAEN